MEDAPSLYFLCTVIASSSKGQSKNQALKWIISICYPPPFPQLATARKVKRGP